MAEQSIDPQAWERIPGALTDKTREWLDELARIIPEGGTFVHVGVVHGKVLAYFIARCHPSVRTVGVELWDNAVEMQVCLYGWAQYAEYIFGRTTLVNDTSEEAAKLFKDESVDALLCPFEVWAPWRNKMKLTSRTKLT